MRGTARMLVPGRYDVKPGIQPAQRWDMLPGGHRVRGINVIPQIIDGVYKSNYADMYTDWPWDAWVKPCIDFAKTLGANTIRFFGTTWGRFPGPAYPQAVPMATYLGRWEQVLNYCRTQGLYVYPTLGGDSDIDNVSYGYDPGLAWVLGEFPVVCRFLEKHRDIIPGVDLYNEAIAWMSVVDGPSMRGVQIYQACKAAAPNLRYTWSSIDANLPPAGTHDFIDKHTYLDPASNRWDADLAASMIPTLIGEFGQNQLAGQAARESRFNTIKTAVQNAVPQNESSRRVAGAIAWSLQDQGSTTALQYGLMSQDLQTTRTDTPPIFATFPN